MSPTSSAALLKHLLLHPCPAHRFHPWRCAGPQRPLQHAALAQPPQRLTAPHPSRRGALDPKAHYKKLDGTKFPKYFQMGTVVEGAADYYSGKGLGVAVGEGWQWLWGEGLGVWLWVRAGSSFVGCGLGCGGGVRAGSGCGVGAL